MSDDSWESYSAGDAEVVVPADAVPVLDAANTDAWQGDQATSWADWNAQIADDAAQYASSEVEYAQRLYAAGFDEAGDAALARAEISYDTASDHDVTAADYSTAAAGEYQAAADGYETAAGYTADATAYDTSAPEVATYDAGGGYEASSSDAGGGYDATSE